MRGDGLRLLADVMLGRLTKWLRLLGYDTEYENDAEDVDLARRARAEGRILLTRDRELAGRTGLQTLFVESEVLEEQVRQVRESLGPPPDPTLSRCSVCNVQLELADRDRVTGRVPAYILRTQQQFRICPGCERVYWRGTHLEKMEQMLDGFFSD
jgi:uncharacterized protein with PIN domain